jgi:hypothetical protein
VVEGFGVTGPSGAPSATTVTTSPNHYGSHIGLLEQIRSVPSHDTQVDAIIVPTARRAASMLAAIELAADLDCTLVALCSRWSSAASTAALAAEWNIRLVAIDTDDLPHGAIPAFATSQLLAGTRLERPTDTSFKRNLGLLLGRLANWERVVFLDDDITVEQPHHLRDAVHLLGEYATVGLVNTGYPDNSVVCHANRLTGGHQATFIGSGALAVSCATVTSFFPDIYNEDWFFLLDRIERKRTAATGHMKQKEYDPFANERRARTEEFGECLAEGLFWLLDEGLHVRDAHVAHWRSFLGRRQRFINEIIDRIPTMDEGPATRARMTSALKAARGRNQIITPELCLDYMTAWHEDKAQWRRHVNTAVRRFGAPPTPASSRKDERNRLEAIMAWLGLNRGSVQILPSRTMRRPARMSRQPTMASAGATSRATQVRTRP